MNDGARPIDLMPGTTGGLLLAALEDGEEVSHLVPAIGCVIALTSERLLLVREGSSFRPKTGVRSWQVADGLIVRPGLVRRGTGSLTIAEDRDLTSVFIRSDNWDAALELAGAVRGRVRVDEERQTDAAKRRTRR
jgi:hypothetical protein